MKKLIITGLLLPFISITQAAVLLSWDVVDGNQTGTLAADAVAQNLSTDTGLNELSRTGVTYFNRNLSYASQDWNTTDTFNANNQYISFSLSADADYEVHLESLNYCINGGNLAPGTGVWGYSTDGGSTWTFSDTFNIRSNGDAPVLDTWDFEDFTIETGTTVEFRFWGYGSTNIAGAPDASQANKPIGIDNTPSNDLILNGTVSSIPEASTSSLLILAGLCLAIVRRRRRNS